MEIKREKVKVSIVIPVYKVSAYIERCMSSVMTQSYDCIECIIVDDASPDDSMVKCERMISDYRGPVSFKVLHHETNRGLSAARNTGTNAATGEYIFYLDSDDKITEDCIERLLHLALRDESIEMVMGNFVFDKSMIPPSEKNQNDPEVSRFMEDTPLEIHTNEKVREWFFHGKTPRPVSVWNKLLRLSFVRENSLYNREGILFEEALWTLRLLRYLRHAAFLHEITYIYTLRPESIITDTKKADRILHFGYTYREIAEQMVPGERIEEIEWLIRDFSRYFFDAPDNDDYQYAYHTFLRQLSDGKHFKEVLRLRVVKCLSGNKGGRLLYRGVSRGMVAVKKIIRMLS